MFLEHVARGASGSAPQARTDVLQDMTTLPKAYN